MNKRKVEYQNYKNATHAAIILWFFASFAFAKSLWGEYGIKTVLICFLVGYGVLLQFMLLVPTWFQNAVGFIGLTFFLQQYQWWVYLWMDGLWFIFLCVFHENVSSNEWRINALWIANRSLTLGTFIFMTFAKVQQRLILNYAQQIHVLDKILCIKMNSGGKEKKREKWNLHFKKSIHF